MKASEALREFAERWTDGYYIETTEGFAFADDKDEFLKDLTALISEHYVSKDEHEKMKHNLTHCGSCGDPLSRDCPRCKHLWET